MAKATKNRKSVRAPKKGKKVNKGTQNLVPFKKGERRVGRAKGTQNRLGVQIKEALLTALEMSGRDGRGKDGAVGYFVWLSRNEPAVFGGLVGKVLPMQINVKDTTEKYTPEQAVERLRERGLPVPESLNNLAKSVGRAVAERQADPSFEDELNGVGFVDGDEQEGEDDDELEDDEEDENANG